MSEKAHLDTELDSIVVTHPRSGVSQITINSEPLGVLRHAVKRALFQTIDSLEKDPGVRCVVVTGVGKAFSVGSDIRDFSQEVGWLLENDYWEANLNQKIEDARFPIIAACNGHALGGGAVLALACDFRTACYSAKFGFPEIKVGAFPSGSGTQRLPRLVGRGRALELMLTGRVFSAQDAYQFGLVEYLFEDNELLTKSLDIAETIAGFSAPVVFATKTCVNLGLREGWQSGLNLESEMRVKTGRSADAIEGRNAFLEKRTPKFNRENED
jgi:enoyl-CoA hydratase/carnithine racemase